MAFTDEDIRIYDKETPAPEGVGEEDSAALYVIHRANGNLEKTRQLGELLAQTLVGDVDRLKNEPYGNQKLVLLSFLILDELEEKLTDGILRQSAAAAFRGRVEELDPAVFALITDSTAFTLYILHDRREGNEECGRVLANLCGWNGDETLIREGNALAEEYRGLFSGIIQSYTFQ